MKNLKIILVLLLCECVHCGYSQSYNQANVALTNFLIRMYENAPFEGVRVVDDYDNQYLISIFSLDRANYSDASQMNRVANVKAMSQASRFFNGSRISSDIFIRMSEKSDGTNDVEITERIEENSVGYVKSLQQLTNFIGEDGRTVFIYYKVVD